MSAIIATEEAMAADGCCADDDGQRYVLARPKVRRFQYVYTPENATADIESGGFLLGVAGDAGVCEGLWALPEVVQLEGGELLSALNQAVLRPLLNKAIWGGSADEAPCLDALLLLQQKGRDPKLAVFDNGGGFYQVVAPAAIGSGAIAALAAYWALVGFDPGLQGVVGRLRIAIESAAAVLTTVGAEGMVVETL